MIAILGDMAELKLLLLEKTCAVLSKFFTVLDLSIKILVLLSALYNYIFALDIPRTRET
jgi:hypothetical protein